MAARHVTLACPDPAQLFRVLNSVVEPTIRAGWAVPGFVPTRLIVLETRGRRTGKAITVPLLAAVFGRHLVVSTFRGPRSQWVKNLAAARAVRYWQGGKERRARPLVFAPGKRAPSTETIPSILRPLAAGFMPATALGWAFAVLVPAPAARPARSVQRRGGATG